MRKINFWMAAAIIGSSILISGANHGAVYPVRNTRSVKNSFPKESSDFHSKVLTGLKTKISTMEHSMERMQHNLESVEDTNKQIEETIHEQQKMLTKLDKNLASLEQVLSMNGNLLSELKEIVQPDEKTFALSNETCGGLLQAHSGYASYTSARFYKGQQRGSLRYSSKTLLGWYAPSCAWVIQANHRSTIKFTVLANELQAHNFYSWVRSTVNSTSDNLVHPPIDAYVVESRLENEPLRAFGKPKVTKLQKGVTYAFQGPLVYVALLFRHNTPVTYLSPFTFRFQYSSSGQRKLRNTLFTQKVLDANAEEDQEQRMPLSEFDLGIPISIPEGSSENISTSVSSIIMTNFTTSLRLRMEWDREKCADNTFFAVFPVTEMLSLGNDSNISNLCKLTNPDKIHLQTFFSTPVMLLLIKPIGQSFPLNLSWSVETSHWPVVEITSLPSVSNKTCGGILGGTSGHINYKNYYNVLYQNGRRCVWVIAPQPVASGSGIVLNFQQSRTTSSMHNANEATNFDHVYLMELTYTNGTGREDGPKITRLNATTLGGMYTAYSREVYVIFYSDFATTSNGFSLEWRSRGNESASESDALYTHMHFDYTFLSEHEGMIQFSQRNSQFFNTWYQVSVFVPLLPTNTTHTPNYIYGMDLHLTYTGISEEDVNNCIPGEFLLFKPARNGIIELAGTTETECQGSGRAIIRNADGMVILISKFTAGVGQSETRSKMTLNFVWELEYPEGDTRITNLEDNKCGGVLIGTRGVLRYKLDQNVNAREDCIWLLNSPNSTTISFQLLKQVTRSPQDPVMVTAIDADSGSLGRTFTLSARDLNQTVVINGSLAVISYRPSADSSTLRKGFLLKYWSGTEGANEFSTETSAEYVEFRLRHSEARSARFLYDDTNQTSTLSGIRQLHLFAYSVASVANVASRPIPTKVEWTAGVFKRDAAGCVYDTIRFFTTVITLSYDQSWMQRARFPDENSTATCPFEIEVANREKIFTSESGAFLVIYSLVGSPVHEGGEQDRKIDFTHSEVAAPTAKAPLLETDDDGYYWGYSNSTFAQRRRMYERILASHQRNRYRGHTGH